MLGLGNKWITLVFVLILIVDKQSHAERWDFEGDHHEDWVDPTDMLRYDSITKQMKPMETFEIVEDKCTSNAGSEV